MNKKHPKIKFWGVFCSKSEKESGTPKKNRVGSNITQFLFTHTTIGDDFGDKVELLLRDFLNM